MCWEGGGRGVRYRTFLPKSRSGSVGVDQWAYKSGRRAREEGRKSTGRADRGHGKRERHSDGEGHTCNEHQWRGCLGSEFQRAGKVL
jgi:hypothetical protein